MKEYTTILLNKGSRTLSVESANVYALKNGNYHTFVSRKVCILKELDNNKYGYLWALQIPTELIQKRNELADILNNIQEMNEYYELEIYQKTNNRLDMVHKFLGYED